MLPRTLLEFDNTPADPARTRITLTAYWHPVGVWGLMYWYAFTPSHFLVFNGMAQAIAKRAETAEQTCENKAR